MNKDDIVKRLREVDVDYDPKALLDVLKDAADLIDNHPAFQDRIVLNSSTSYIYNDGEECPSSRTVIVCSDNTVWYNESNRAWILMPPIPQKKSINLKGE